MWNLLTAGSDFVSDSLLKFAESTGVAGFFTQMGWGSLAMIGVAFFLMYLAIRHKFEPLLLFTIAFGMLLTNLPGANLYHTELFAGDMSIGTSSWPMPVCSTTSIWVSSWASIPA